MSNVAGGRIEIGRVDEVADRLSAAGGRSFEGAIDGDLEFGFNFFLELVDSLLVEDAFAQ